MRSRVLTVYGLVLLIFAIGFGLGAQGVATSVQAQTSTYLSASPITSTLHTTQVWMVEPFCVRTWWYDEHSNLVRLCSEDKGSDTPSLGVPHKVDLPGPAALVLIGKGGDGRWELSAVALAKPDSQLPGANFVRVTGPTLVTILNSVTPSPVVPPPASVTPSPPGVTATPTATGGVATFTPSPPTPTFPIQTITPTPMFPQFPTCTTQILLYYAGDPAQGGLGGKVGSVSWCGSCNSGCGLWMFGVSKETLDHWTDDANQRVHELWMTVTVEAGR